MKSEIRMVGLDLDGTVFNNKKEITPHTKEVLEQAIRQGCVILPATGRPQIGLPKAFLEIPGVEYALTSNGARILRISSGETVYEELIPWELTLQVIEVLKQWEGEGCNWETYFNGKIYVDADTYHFVRHASMSPAMEQYIRSTRQRQKDLTEKIRSEKIGMEKLHLIFADTRQRDQREKELQQMFPQLSICHATPFNMEIISGKAGKGNALCALGKILGIEKEAIMACGDAPNDWNMLEMAGFPVVMENADEETRKKGRFITKSNEEDGVAYAIERFVLKTET